MLRRVSEYFVVTDYIVCTELEGAMTYVNAKYF